MHVNLQIKVRLESGGRYAGALKLICVETAIPRPPDS